MNNKRRRVVFIILISIVLSIESFVVGMYMMFRIITYEWYEFDLDPAFSWQEQEDSRYDYMRVGRAVVAPRISEHRVALFKKVFRIEILTYSQYPDEKICITSTELKDSNGEVIYTDSEEHIISLSFVDDCFFDYTVIAEIDESSFPFDENNKYTITLTLDTSEGMQEISYTIFSRKVLKSI